MTTDPFFLVYRRRSGSTFLSNLLCGSPEIGIAPESSFLGRLWKSKMLEARDEGELRDVLDGFVFREARFSAWGIEREEAWSHLAPRLPLTTPEIARWFIHTCCKRRFPGSTIHGMKKGGWNAQNIDALRRLFPTARFVMLLRDGRASFASGKKARHTSSGKLFDTNPRREAFSWQKVVRSFERHRSSDYALLVRYEDLVSDPRTVLRSILEFLGLPATQDRLDAMLQPGQRFHFDPAAARLHENVARAPLHPRIDAWREELTPKEIREFELVAGPALERNGYPLLFPGGMERRIVRLAAIVEDTFWRGRKKLAGALRGS